MNEEAKEEIQAVLLLLKNTLVKNGVSMGLDCERHKIMFFDTETYLRETKFKGFTVKIDDLVK